MESSKSDQGDEKIISFVGGRKYMNAAKADDTAVTPKLEEFTCFRRLPPEIRLKIWKLAAPQRIHLVGPYAEIPKNVGPYLPRRFEFEYAPCTALAARKHHALPAVALSCPEAQVAYNKFVKGNAAWWCQPVQYTVQPNKRPEQTWFDPAGDVLCVDLMGHYRYTRSRLGQEDNELKLDVFAKHLRAVAFSFSRSYDGWIGEKGIYPIIVKKMTDRTLWPRLETFLLYEKMIFLHPRPGATLPSELLSVENPIALVNVRDTERIRRFKELYKNTALPSHRDPEVVEHLSSLLTTEGRNSHIDHLRLNVTSLWANILLHDLKPVIRCPYGTKYRETHCLTRDQLDPSKHYFIPWQMDHPWVQNEIMPRMPQIQMVVAFKLCVSAHHPGPVES
ncbi:hypothetical protein PG996_009138 [Apiospora saccharicola]|uniref:2EXR domain-containing protein n=1 Tax=Apiospora saccharicola TaxID=335842 RepID=A0ABR1UMT9_9PEZI